MVISVKRESRRRERLALIRERNNQRGFGEPLQPETLSAANLTGCIQSVSSGLAKVIFIFLDTILNKVLII